jgi:hypothetical protein
MKYFVSKFNSKDKVDRNKYFCKANAIIAHFKPCWRGFSFSFIPINGYFHMTHLREEE